MSDIIKVGREFISNVEKIDELIDSFVDPIKDITDTAKDLLTPIKIVHSLYTYNKKRKFKKFLKYYATSLTQSGINNENDIKWMEEYLKDEKNYNLINDIIESAIQSKSIYGAMLLGYFAGNILIEKPAITFKHLIIIDALRELNDFELAYFTKLYSVANLANVVDVQDYKKQLHNTFVYEITIQKMIQLRVADEAPIIHSNKQRGRFSSNEMGEDIYFQLIRDSGIEDKLLNYDFG